MDHANPRVAHAEAVDLLVADAKTTVGGLCFNGVCKMLEQSGYSAEPVAQTWHIFGDAATHLWTKTPMNLTSVNITDNGSSITVDAGIQGSTICVSSGNNGNPYWNRQDNVQSYTFYTTNRPLYVTIIKHNYIPYTAVTAGTFTSNETWFGNLQLLGNVTFSTGKRLNILSGTSIKFIANAKLTLYGSIIAEGTSLKPITFTSTASNPAPGNWYGIEIKSGPNSLKYCDVKYATQGITVNSTAGTTIENCLIDYCSLYGIYGLNSMANGAIYIKGTSMKHCGWYGLSLNNAWVSVGSTPQSGSIIESNTKHGLHSISGYALIDHTTFQNNLMDGIYVNSGSNIYLAQNGTGPGYNVIKNNTGNQIKIYYCANAFLGYRSQMCICGEALSSTMIGSISSIPCDPPCYWRYDEQGGYNSISGNDEWIYNLGSSCNAHLTYWDVNPICPVNPPASSHFTGTVSTSYPQCYSSLMAAGMLDGPIGDGAELSNNSDRIPDYDYDDSLHDIALTKYLVRLLYELPDSAEDALPILLPLVGPCGKYQNILKMSWESFLMDVEKSIPNDNIQKQARMYRILNRMFAKDYTGIITLTDQMLSRNLGDDLWFYCQAQRISALVLMNKIVEAKNILDDIKTRAISISNDGYLELSRMITLSSSIETSPGVAIEEGQTQNTVTSVPEDYGLEQNYPNPFNPTTTINYTIPEDCKVTLRIYNTLGQMVRSIVDSYQEAGKKSVTIDLGALPSGLYFYRLRAGKYTEVKKMLLVR